MVATGHSCYDYGYLNDQLVAENEHVSHLIFKARKQHPVDDVSFTKGPNSFTIIPGDIKVSYLT
jgi:hypothetical protein